jgi:hypothetical protein
MKRFLLLILLLVGLFTGAKAQVIFSEDFTSGTFTTNNWAFPSGQANWAVGTAWAIPGGTLPQATFNWTPTLTSYSHELVTPVINATTFAGGSVFLSYKLYYNNFSTATLEQFAVEYKPTSGTTWFLLTNYTNIGGTFNVNPTNVILPAMAGQNFQIRFRPYGANSYNINGWGLDDIQVLALNPCTGTPTAGAASALPANPCPGDIVTLSLTGASVAGGLAYQWQRANSPTAPASAWVNIGTGNPLLYSPPAGTTTFYRCIVTCTATGLTSTSSASGAVIVQSFSPTSPCYCPCTNMGTSCITNITFGGLNSTTAPCTNAPTYYNFYTTPVLNYTQGLNYSFSMVTDANAITSVWIDWNHNTVFEPTEWTQVFTTGTTGSVNILVPPSSLVGQTRMRVRSRISGNQNGSGDACLAMGSGETEDYIINVLPAGPYDLNVSAVGAPVGNTCTDSTATLTATICNFGSNPIVTNATNPVTVLFKVYGPSGLTTYPYTFPAGLTIGAFGASCQTATVSPVNLYTGGSYFINAVVSTPSTLTNAFAANDSLSTPVNIINYRPTAGAPYQLCQYSSIPFGQGLSVGGCTAPIYDSIELTFNLTTCVDNVGATTTGTTQGPGNANCNNLYAGNFGNVTIPTLPAGSYFTQNAKLTITNLSSGFPTECRFILYSGNPATTLFSGCQLGYPGPVGDTLLAGLSSGTTTSYSYSRRITPSQLSSIFAVPGTPLNLGYWESYNDLTTTSDIGTNAGGTPTVAKLKVYYQYVPPAYAWYDVPSGGSSLYSLTPFNPLAYTNAVVNNSNVPGNYTFYAACLGLSNCRVPVRLNINPTPTAYQDTLLGCEYAVGANSAIFILDTTHSVTNQVSGGNIAASVAYFGDQTVQYYPILNVNNDTSSTNFIYSKVFYPSTGCYSSDSVLLDVHSIPQFSLPIYIGNACAPNAIDISSLINVFPTTNVDTLFFDDANHTIPYSGNVHAINTVDSVYMIVKTNNGVVCSDTAVADIQVLPATNNIANQDIAGNYSICGSVGCGNISLTDGTTQTLYTTADCRRIATITDAVDGVSLGTTTICEDIDCSIQDHNGQPYVARHYQITPTVNDSALVCLYYLDQDFADYDAAAFGSSFYPLSPTANLCISKVDNGDITDPGHTAVSIPNSAITTSFDAATSVWTVCFPVSGFSYFYCHTCNPLNIALPVTLLSFTGERKNGQSALTWVTSREENNSHFIVERSLDAKSFSPISTKIPTQAVGGNSNSNLSYTYNDAHPTSGHNYYRLQQVDIDGNRSYSQTVDVYFGTESMVSLYPNPVNTELNVDIQSANAGHAWVKVLDATGRVVRMIEADLHEGRNSLQVDLSQLTDGMYRVDIHDENGLHYTGSVQKK